MNTPTPTEFIAFLEPSRADMPNNPSPSEAGLIAEHFSYLSDRAHAGTVTLAGRTLEPPHLGLVIIRALDAHTAQSILDADPAVAAGLFRVRLQSFRTAITAVATG